MNREILFRAKRVDNHLWIKGNFVSYTDYDGRQENLIYATNGNPNNILVETLCEYTGLTDKNGKQIFEGDIVKTKYYGKDSGCGQNFNEYDYFTVVFHEASFCIENAIRRFIITAESAKRFEIVGNVFDNPELLLKAGQQ